MSPQHTRSMLLAGLIAGVAVTTQAAGSDPAQLKRGAFLADVTGCGDCHTPFKMGPNGPEKDLSRKLSGHPEELKLPPAPKLEGPWNWVGSATMTAFNGPWGTTYATNLTPDKETGIGSWTQRDFVRALRTGKHLGVSRPILPPMPWQNLSILPERDLQAIYTYLMSLPPIKNKVPEYAPPAGAPAKP